LLSVAGRESSSGPDPENWFDEPDLSEVWEARSERLARSRPPPLEGERQSWIDSATRWPWRSRRARPQIGLVVAAALGVTLLLGLLAAAGVFSSTHVTVLPTLQTTVLPPPSTTGSQPPRAQPPLTVPGAALTPGAQGTAVQQLQRVLAYLGYSPGAADGRYGPSTEAAVRRFQEAHGLVIDGIAGSATLTALKSALP
jgi:putative peptidoglycan binding protein